MTTRPETPRTTKAPVAVLQQKKTNLKTNSHKTKTMGTKDKNNISLILKIVIAVATAILGAFGVNAAI